MRIPSNQIYHVMTSFTRQLVSRLRLKDRPSTDEPEPTENILTDHVRREAVLKQVTTEILSRIIRLNPKSQGQTDIRIQCSGDGNSVVQTTEEKRLVYDAIEPDGSRRRRELRVTENGGVCDAAEQPPQTEKKTTT